MANTVNRIYHIHQFHLDTNFMPTPLRTRHENTHGQMQNSEFEMNTTEANVTTEETVEVEDDFQSINLELSDSENHVGRQTSIANDNFDEGSIKTVYPLKRFDGSIYPQADIHTQNSFSGVPRKRLRQWSENDLYMPEMRNYYRNRTFSNLQQPLEHSMSSNMQRINEELQSHSQQLQQISNDVQHLYKVESNDKNPVMSPKESGFDLILKEIRDLRADLTENREQLTALREDVNMLIKKRI